MQESAPKLTDEFAGLNAQLIARYQLNNYYYVGSFDFMKKGAIVTSTTQTTKGLIAPLVSMNIRTFSDDLKFTKDDLVVVDGHLYAVEDPEVTEKRLPKPFRITFMTLNSIL